MARPFRRGFTLVEMLVVITIIGMLVALLIPAALGVQNAARRTVCINNMRELTLACLRYENKNGRFPPQFYFETWPRQNNDQVQQRVGWIVTILEELGKGELAGLFRDKKLLLPPQPYLGISTGTGAITATEIVRNARLTIGHSYISQLVCPANPPASLTKASLSYVCNAGIDDSVAFTNSERPDDFKENGVFMNYHVNYAPQTEVRQSPNEKVSIAFINDHDGTSQTFLLSENVNADVWAQDVTLGPLVGAFYLSPTPYQQGMLWSMSSLPAIEGLGSTRVADPNEEIFTRPPLQVGIHSPELLVARPSSLHGGGYHAAFCSGNVMWLSNQMDKGIYALLMTPWGEHAKNTFGVTIKQSRGNGMSDIINEVELAK